MQVIESSGQNKSIWIKVRNIFITGLFALLPLVVTYFFLAFLLRSMTGFLLPYFDLLDQSLHIGMLFMKR